MAPSLPMTTTLVKPLWDGQPDSAKYGFIVICGYKGASYFSYALAIVKPDFLFEFPERPKFDNKKFSGNSQQYELPDPPPTSTLSLTLPSHLPSNPREGSVSWSPISSAQFLYSFGQDSNTSESSDPLL